MSGQKKRSILKIALKVFGLLVVGWALLFVYLVSSPKVAQASCIDNGGIYFKEHKKCYCHPDRMPKQCDASIDDLESDRTQP